MVDKPTILQIFGCLMQHPQYLSESDKYNLTPDDFYYRLDKYIFAAIDSLYRNGAERIQPIDVENYLNTNESAKAIFKQQKGIEYLQDAEYLSEETNFPYYYKKLKKFNLLESFKDKGFDVTEFYVEDAITPTAQAINEKFEKLEINDIVDGIKRKLLGVEREFIQNDTTETVNVFEGIKDILEDAEAQADVGAPIQGEIFNEVCAGARKGIFVLRSGGSGVSKAIPNYTLIPTPNGWQRVGEIKVGDFLFGQDGKLTKVIGVHPQPNKKKIYKVILKDGRVAECCNEHLWEFRYSSHGQYKTKVENLQYLIDKGIKNTKGGYKFSIPVNKPIEYLTKSFSIPPYVLGAILGDGCLMEGNKNRSLQFSSKDKEIVAHMAELMNCNYIKSAGNNYTWYFQTRPKLINGHWIKNIQIREYFTEYPELINTNSYTKFIPQDYLFGDIHQRLELLQGLLDTDGSIDEKGRIEYSTVSKHLANDVVELCRSLGYIPTISKINGEHYNQGYIYKIHIQASPEEKINMFYLTRKKEKAILNSKKEIRRETRDYIPIIDIIETDQYTDMTCFTVDNDSHLFLMNDYIVTHNTRQAVGDACYLAFPFRYDIDSHKWVQEGSNKKVLFIATEQNAKEIQKMILAYLTGFNETKFRYGGFTEQEQLIIKQALWVMEQYQNNFYIVRMPNPTIELVKTIVRENVMMHDIEYVFYDYIFISPSLLNEFKGFNLRNDEILLMFSTALKDLAVELNIFMMSSTQVNANADNNQNIRNEGSIAGSRSIINKADIGAIMARPTKEELEFLRNEDGISFQPNIVTDIYKVRSGEWNQVRIWSDVNLGNLRKRDLFVTNARMEVLNDVGGNFNYQTSWEDDMVTKLTSQLKVVNELK